MIIQEQSAPPLAGDAGREGGEAQTARRRAFRWARWAAVPLVTGGLLWYFLTRLPAGSIAGTFRHVSAAPLLISIAGAAVFMVARAWRYRILLTADRPPPFGAVIAVTFAAWWPGLLLPGLTSDAVFIYLANRRLGSTVVRAGGAALAARVLDVMSLLAIGLATAPVAGARLPRAGAIGAVGLLIIGVLLLGGLLWRPYRTAVLGFVARLPKGRRLAERAERALDALGDLPRVVALGGSTLAARFATAVQYTALFAALGQALTLWQAWFALSLRTLLLAIPVQGVAGLGTTQLWWTAALAAMGWAPQRAATIGFQIHLLDLTVSVPLSLLGGLWLLLRWRRAR